MRNLKERITHAICKKAQGLQYPGNPFPRIYPTNSLFFPYNVKKT